eukprot:gene3994-4624_t
MSTDNNSSGASGTDTRELSTMVETMTALLSGNPALYNALRQCLETHVDTVQRPSLIERGYNDPPLSFVQEVIDQWKAYKKASLSIRDCVMYLERVYTVEANIEGVIPLATRIYRSTILDNFDIKRYLCNAVATII